MGAGPYLFRPATMPSPPEPENSYQSSVPEFLGAGDFVYRGHPVPRFVGGEGCRLTDAEGNVYVDGEAANGTLALGYDRELLHAASAGSAALPALPSFCESDLRLKVAERLANDVSEATGHPGRVSFEVGGAQGIELAMKIVACNRGWGSVATFQGSYHGRSPFAATLSSSARYRHPIALSAGEIVRLPYPDYERSPLGSSPQAASDASLAYLRSLGWDQSGAPKTFSAFLFEPLLNVGGMAVPDNEYLVAAIEQFRAAGALVVVDEIFTGFHRVGPRFGFEMHGIDPDIVVLSKALTNGIGGLSAVWAREPLLDPDHFPPGTHSSTFAGTPFMLSVADLVLQRFSERSFWSNRMAELERALSELAQEVASAVPNLVTSAKVHGAVARFVLRRPVAWEVRAAALHPGAGGSETSPRVLLASTGMAPDVVAVHPPLTIDADDLHAIQEGLIRALRSVE